MNKRPVSYLQTDSRWKSKPYQVKGETATIGGSGCGPSCAAMLIETLTGETFTPEDACNWSMAHGYKALNQGTYYSYFGPQFSAFGLSATQLNGASLYGKPNDPTHDQAFGLLQQGYYLIACMGKGLWTSSGHFVVVWWEDGKVRINDPASTKDARLNGDLQTFRAQVKYYWAIDAREYNKEEIDMTKEEVQAMIDAAVDKALAERDGALAQAAQTVSPWAAEMWKKAVSAGVFDGTRPGGTLTREQAAVVLDRMGLFP